MCSVLSTVYCLPCLFSWGWAMARMQGALRRRIVPSVLLTLDLRDDDGSVFQRNFRLTFDFNAFARIQERSGLDMMSQNVWALLTPASLSVMLWAAVLACHPEYDSDDGLIVIRSYMDAGNQDLIAEKLFECHAAALPEDRRKALMEAKEKALRGENPTLAAQETRSPETSL